MQGFKNGVSYGFSGFSFTLGSATSNILRNLNQSFSGKRLLTTNLVGVRADSIPSSGTDGPPYAYNDLNLPADNERLIRGFITTFPSAGVLNAADDTSFTFSGAPGGTYSFIYDLYVDDTKLEPPATATLNVTSPTSSSLSVILDDLGTSVSSQVFPTIASFAVTLDNLETALSAIVSPVTSISTSLADAIFSGSAQVVALASLNVTLDPLSAAISLESANNATLNIITDSPILDMSAQSGVGSFISTSLDSVVFTGSTFSIVFSESALNTSTSDAVFVGGSSGSLPGIATLNGGLVDVVWTGVVSGSSVSDASANIALDAIVVSASSSSIYTGTEVNTTLADTIFVGSSVVIPPTNSTAFNIILEDEYVYMTAVGSDPPISIGPNVKAPIALGMTIDG